MDASGSLARAFSVLPSSNSNPQTQTHAAEAEVLAICNLAGVCCIGITADRVVFQLVGTSLSVPLAEFQDAAEAVALIRQKLAEGGL